MNKNQDDKNTMKALTEVVRQLDSNITRAGMNKQDDEQEEI